MSRQDIDPMLEPQESGRLRPPDRPVYALGVLLDSADFVAEQSYHRGRLARALAHLHGSGTVAGLRVEWQPGLEPGGELPEGREERLRVHPGLAVDRLGRLVELRQAHCLRLEQWWQDQSDGALRVSLANPPADFVVADVFFRFTACERGKTPAFAEAPAEALDAVVASRLRDSAELELVLRQENAEELGPEEPEEPPLPPPEPPERTPEPPLPADPWAAIDADPAGAEHQGRLRDALLGAWREGSDFVAADGTLDPAAEHAPGQDPTAVFLARARLPAALPPADPGGRPVRTGDPVEIDNHSRRFLVPPAALAVWLGIGR